MQRVPMTVHGAETLKKELHHLKTVMRKKITDSIAEARAHGDLKENAEYHAAREQQSFSEGRIQEIEAKLSNAQVIDVTQLQNNGKIVFGATAHLINTDTDEEVVYQVVGEDEANIKEGKVSVTSPVARALIGKEVDDVVSVRTPNGEVEYEVHAVEYI